MYQDKIESETKARIENDKKGYNHPNVFIREKLQPLNFLIEEEGDDAAHIARDILSKRTNEEIVVMSQSIDWMLQIGENLLTTLSMKILAASPNRKSISLSQGRALYILCDYFDLSTIAVKKLKWCEIFATLALMQVAEIVGSRHRAYDEDDMSQAMKAYSEQFILDMAEETIDSIARAECLFDKKEVYSSSGAAGGAAKAKHIEPLKIEVINRYIKNYTSYSNKKAGEIIDAELSHEKHTLLLLSEAEELNLQFAKWIGAFNKGKWKHPIKN
jgi:hypothetical protein